MYKMPEFTEKDMTAVIEFMKAHSFITLIGNDGSRSEATQVPVLFSEKDGEITLRGHIMRKTGHHLAFEKNPEVLALFTGPHCYVSASWYSERHIGSTWNYMTVHARGTMRFLDEAGTTGIIMDLTHKYEDGRENPELVEYMPQEYVQGMVKAIVGFELPLSYIYPLFKLSQNRDEWSYKNIIQQLVATERYEEGRIAEEMVKRQNHD
jgi:transcriptional regulator